MPPSTHCFFPVGLLNKSKMNSATPEIAARTGKDPFAVLGRYLERLHQSARRGGLLQAYPTQGVKRIDLARFSLLSPTTPGDIVTRLLHSEHGKINLDLDISEPARGEQNPQRDLYLNLATGLARVSDAFKRETGVRSLWLAYPLFRARVKDTQGAWQSVLAPVFLWPVRIEAPLRAQGRITLQRDEEAGGAKYNKALDLWITDNLGFNPEDPHLEVFEETTLASLNEVVQKLYAGLRPPPAVNLSEAIQAVPARETTDPQATATILNSGILGLIQWEKQALTYDLETLLRTRPAAELLSDYLTGKGRVAAPPPAPPSESDRFLITDTDPAQERAVWQSRQGPGLVVHGPPGTGKSQTIVNMVADALAHGQRVLVMCQKKAAVDVVATRLTAQGLNDLFCVVHDSESDRSRTILTVKEQVAALRAPEAASQIAAQRTQLAAEIERLEKQMDDYCRALCEPGSSGIPYRELLVETNRLYRAQPHWKPSTGLKPLFAGQTQEVLRGLQAEVTTVAKLWQKAQPRQNPWQFRKADYLLDPMFRDSVTQVLHELQTENSAHAALAGAIGVGVKLTLPPADFVANTPRWFEVINEAKAPGNLEPAAFMVEWASREPVESLEEGAANLTAQLEPFRGQSQLDINPDWSHRCQQAGVVTVQKWLDMVTQLKVWEGQFWRWFVPQYYYFKIALKKALGITEDLDHSTIGHVHGFLVFWLEGQVQAMLFAVELHRAAALEPALQPIIAAFIKKDATGVQKQLNLLIIARKRAEVAVGVYAALLRLDEWLQPEYVDKLKLAVLAGDSFHIELEAVIHGFAALEALQQLDRHRTRREGLSRAVLEVLDSEEPEETMVGDFAERWWHITRISANYAWIEEMQSRRPVLRELSVSQYEEQRGQLAGALNGKRALEATFIKEYWRDRQLNRKKGDFGGVLVSRGPNSKRLRQVVELGEPAGLFDFRPCWLTNPNTASQIFPLTPGFFDLIIFDEASQCPIEQAVPAIFRAKRVVVAGDEKQLPPTAFFQTGFSFSGEEPGEEEPGSEAEPDLQQKVAQAGVDQALAVSDLLEASKPLLPECLLNVHYRSAYPELIQFSNHAFYGGQLQVPPTCLAARFGQAPLVLKEVKGIYEKNRNLIEAREIVTLLRELWTTGKTPPTVGVVTFNERQRDLIEDLLLETAEHDPAFDALIQTERARMDGDQDVGFFVKNLESVQGDERDIMVFSTTFGRDAAGQFRRFFGPINLLGGERRLNVAVTRARLANFIVTSMPLGEISDKLSGGTSPSSGSVSGRDYLHAFMQYAQAVSTTNPTAQKQVLELLRKLGPANGTPVASNSTTGFEQEVRAALEAKGCLVESRIGESGFTIDLAIRHPAPARGYLLGIECDGKLFHPDWSARARDVWRQRILERRGWKLHRVWSTDWWLDPEEEVKKIMARVKTNGAE